jgi:ribose 5-phosphate isomerase B
VKVAVSADHRGAHVLGEITMLLQHQGCQVVEMDVPNHSTCDYPDCAYLVARAVASGEADRGVLICGSGIGMSIAANKVHGVRAALVYDEIGAEMARRHNDANVLCLPADLIGARLIERIVVTWINAGFDGGRHARRIAKISAIEKGDDPAGVQFEESDATAIADPAPAGDD